MKSKTFNNKIALVTGAGSGIGKASAIAFSNVGATVVLVDIDPIGANDTLAKVRKYSRNSVFVKTDLSKSNNIILLFNKVIKKFGRLDYAFNNAGIAGKIAKTADCTVKNWEHVIRNNLKSVWLCLKHEIIQMKKQNFGVIVNMSSVYGLIGCERGLPAYVASKHGIIGLTRTAALEYASSGIRVNAICPGAIDTPFRQQLKADCKENTNINNRYPIGRIGTDKEVADVVLWLCSDSSSFITGSVITIDGGLSAK